jgi:glutamate N-acetyltransferase / amino-acid N-acetyltransferase
MAVTLVSPSLATLEWFEDLGVTHPAGFRGGAAWCGLKSSRKDLCLIASDGPAGCAGVFTRNLVKASSVVYSERVVRSGSARAIFCNAGNANACTGDRGMDDTLACASLTADALGLGDGDQVLVAATGIIGVPLPVEKIREGLPQVAAVLARGAEADDEVAKAILTTDTCTKQVALTVTSPHWDGELRIGGVTKGSGMIAPNMATTLCFLTTDARIDPPLLQRALSKAMDRSFNRLTVDGDTSTNDMALILANGTGPAVIEREQAFEAFAAALEAISLDLAKRVARDGEGATKLVAVRVTGAATEEDAAQVAKTIAESALVKTALFGCDPNWGRVLAAAGRSGIPFDPDQASLRFGSHLVFAAGAALPFDKLAAHDGLKAKEVEVHLDLGGGHGEATFWTCDYSYDYIRINAEYHT